MDRKIIAINLDNGILLRMARLLGWFSIFLAVFGLMCGICYWLLVRTKEKVSLARKAKR